MQIGGVDNGALLTSPGVNSSPSSEQGLNRDSFMQLLLLQMRSQDPMNPMDSSQMFQQMAQLTTLEQLWDMRELMKQSAASQQLSDGANLIGRHVEASSPGAGTVSGLVEQVRMVSGSVYLQIGEQEVRLDEVVSVQ